jgi:3-methylcrotonyl-CoA carboxylase alpha subunit
VCEKDGHFTLFNNDTHASFDVVLPSLGDDSDAGHDANFDAPMNGTIVALLVEPGTKVEKGQPILIMEAMKMEHSIVAPKDGVVDSFYFNAGELVDGGATLLAFTADGEEE